MRAALERISARLWRMCRPYAQGGVVLPKGSVILVGEHGPETLSFPPAQGRP